MKNAPIKAISYSNNLLYSKSNVLYSSNSQIKLKDEIIDIKCYNSKILVVFKRQILLLSQNFDYLTSSELFEANIAAVLFNECIYILLYNGTILNYCSNSLVLINHEHIFYKTIISAKFLNKQLVIGSFDSIYSIDLNSSEKKPSFLFEKIHSGRIFNIYLSENKILSCADDRAICINGKKIIGYRH